MLTNFRYIWNRLRTSFWFVPAVMAIAAFVLSVSSLALDQSEWGEMVRNIKWSYDIGVDGARLFLSTIAGSMITVTSLVFSLTLIALTLASSQLGPRLLNIFMSDIVVQTTMGLFIATFLFSLLTLRAVSDSAGVPEISITLVFLLTLISFAWLIYFIHHIAQNIQADNTVARVSRSLNKAIREREAACEISGASIIRDGEKKADHTKQGRSICSNASGYVRTLDLVTLYHMAANNDMQIAILVEVGDYVICDTEVARVYRPPAGDDSIDDRINGAINLGPVRTPNQDIDYAINGLTEIAARALSPGINDYFTALTCMDHLTDALVLVLRSKPPVIGYKDDTDTTRLLVTPKRFGDMMNEAFHAIRQNGESQFPVLMHLSKSLAILASCAGRKGERKAIAHHTEFVKRVANNKLSDPVDQETLLSRVHEIEKKLQV